MPRIALDTTFPGVGFAELGNSASQPIFNSDRFSSALHPQPQSPAPSSFHPVPTILTPEFPPTHRKDSKQPRRNTPPQSPGFASPAPKASSRNGNADFVQLTPHGRGYPPTTKPSCALRHICVRIHPLLALPSGRTPTPRPAAGGAGAVDEA